jgi:hypothetical protein
MYDHHTGKPLKLEDFEPQVRAHSNVVSYQCNTCTVYTSFSCCKLYAIYMRM